MSDTFCPLPWMFQAVRNNGDYRICCQANTSEDRGILKYPDGRPANASIDNSEEARNLPLMKNARQQMLKGQWPKSCVRCQREEAAGLRSRRIYEMQNWGKHFTVEKARTSTASDGEMDLAQNPLLSLDLRFGNKCNLKCRMCGPTDSDLWYGDHVQMDGPTFKDTHGLVHLEPNGEGWRAKNDDYTWYERGEDFWQSLESRLPHLKHLHLVGGEPLLLPQHYKLLDKIVSEGHASHVTIEYNTNLTVLPDRVLKLWQEFEKVRVGVSLDGMGPVNDYIRHPSRWEVVERNLRRLDKAMGNIEAWISCSVQIYNIFHLPDLIEWKLRAGFQRISTSKHLPLITSHPVHNPIHLNIQTLPREMKDQVTEKFAQFLKTFANWAPPQSHVEFEVLQTKLKQLLDGYIKFMNAEDRSENFAQFLNYTQRLDQLRGEDFAKACPQLAKAIAQFRLELGRP